MTASPDYIAGLRRAAEIARDRQRILKDWAKWHLKRLGPTNNFEATMCGICRGEATAIAVAIEAEAAREEKADA